MTPDVYVVGMSNTIAVQSALQTYDGPVRFLVDNLTSPDAAGSIGEGRRLNPKFFKDKLDAKLIITMFYGMWYNSLALVENPEPFDFMIPEYDTEVDTSRRLIPFSQIHRKFANRLRGQLKPLVYLRRMTTARMVFFEPQPPIESEKHILTYPGAFRDALTAGVTPGRIRLKLWKLQNMITADVCAEHGLEFLPFASEATSDGGYIREGFYFDDPGHANAAYGRIAIRQMEELFHG